MTAGNRLAGLLLILLLLVVAFLVWRGTREGGGAARADAVRTELPEPETGRAGGQGETASDPGESADGEVRVSGTVTHEDGSPGPVGFVFAVAEVDGRRRMLNARVKADRGTFAITFAFEGASSPWRVDLGMRAAGFVHLQRSLKVVPGGEYRVAFVLEEGSVLAGVVLGPHGNPVPGLEVVARSMEAPQWGLVAGHMIDPHRLLIGSGQEIVHHARATTDAAGQFELRDLPDGTFGLFSGSEDWFLTHDGLLRPPDRNVRVRAVGAHSVVGTVTDARTGEPIPRASAILVVLSPNRGQAMKAVSVFDGRLWVAWKPAEDEEDFEVEALVSANGYREGRETLRFPRGTRRGSLRIGLEPIAALELGTTIVEVVDAWGRRVDLPMSFRLTASGPSEAEPEAYRAESEGEGVYRLLAPEGRWSLRVWPRRSLGAELEWRGELRVWSGREGTLTCSLPPHGTLRVRRATFPEGSKPWILGVDSADGSKSLLSQVEHQEIRVVVGPGEWDVEITGSPTPGVRRVTVRPGEEITVLFE